MHLVSNFLTGFYRGSYNSGFCVDNQVFTEGKEKEPILKLNDCL